ncbi:MAG: hypothetical protein KKD86_04870 [Bacteroidetes bacterium]|nr:hypothetical protein [Bacteroidota bacterium]
MIVASLGFTLIEKQTNILSGQQNNHSQNTNIESIEELSWLKQEFNESYRSFSDSTFADSLNSLSENNLFADSLDSLSVNNPFADSVLIDTTKVDSMAIDSTGRISQFRYQRSDSPVTNVGDKKTSGFFAAPGKQHYKKTVELDSTGQFVIIKESLGDGAEKIFLKMRLEEYIDLKIKANNRQLWEEQGYKYEIAASKDDLSSLLKDITNIEIPLPSTSFLSIFGPNVIKLRINGAVDIHGAWRNETTEGLTASALGNTRNEPDFSQQVQISVNGTIGDKLTINADWNTERTFEYENELKINYKGYEDEIVQSVEAGNVSLQTSPLVGGSEALFGIKSQFKMGPLTLTALASQKKGEIQEVSIS